MKNKKKKSRKEGIFPKGLVHGFDEKLAIFPSFYFRQKGQHSVFQDILERKKRLSTLKKQQVKRSQKIGNFRKGHSPWSWSKKGNCSILFIFGKIGQKNVFRDILQRKTSFKDIKNSNVKKSKNWDFSKGVSPWF